MSLRTTMTTSEKVIQKSMTRPRRSVHHTSFLWTLCQELVRSTTGALRWLRYGHPGSFAARQLLRSLPHTPANKDKKEGRGAMPDPRPPCAATPALLPDPLPPDPGGRRSLRTRGRSCRCRAEGGCPG